MRFVDRASIDEPRSLADPSAAVAAEINEAQLHYRTYDPLDKDAKAFDFKEYKSYDVQNQLRTLFHNKCAYCESDLGDTLEVEHFRPKGGVTEDRAHFGYWWLAHTWTNLLPSCIPCNQKRYQHLVTEEMTVDELTKLLASKAKVAYGKANHFPIAGIRARCSADILNDERAELINPTFDDPTIYLKWSTSGHYSIVLPRPSDADGIARALSTISIFALNRARLVESRTRILNLLRFQAQKMFESLERDMVAGGTENYLDRALERVEIMRQFHDSNQPYSAMVKEFVDGVVEQLQRRIAS